MIIVTGAAGFIGSNLVSALNRLGYKELIVVDEFSRADKNQNLEGKSVYHRIDRMEFFSWLQNVKPQIDFVFHLGARTDTTEFNISIFDRLNLNFSKNIWKFCVDQHVPLIYASSAATYGMGELGFDDDVHLIPQLKPLNPYGDSKNDFDKWVLQQDLKPPHWYGLKFFNVFGPNEYHKGRMASVIFHAYNQILKTGKLKLFRSHHPDFQDGKQLRDFIYVKDVVEVMIFIMQSKINNDIYNLGTGKARTFFDLGQAVFHELGLKENIEFIDTPLDIRDKYQYFTEAKMDKLKRAGYQNAFTRLEAGISDYVLNFLKNNKRN